MPEGDTIHHAANRIRPVLEGRVPDELATPHPRMQQSAQDGFQTRAPAIYGRAGVPCPRCGATIRRRGQWEDNRPTYWCPGCQH